MGTRFRGIAWMPMSILVAALATTIGLSPSPAAAQTGEGEYVAPRLPGTDQSQSRRNLAGVHHRQLGSAGPRCRGRAVPPIARNLGGAAARAGCGPGQRDPLSAEALARKRDNLERRLAVDHDNVNTVGDPEAKCYLPGVPRATYMPFPFQIIQSTDKVIIAYQFASASRTIPLGGSSEAPVDSWMGWSNGRWEGDTLVVEVSGFNDLSWFDRAGNYHSAAMEVVERYTPISPYHMMYEATIEDPEVFTRHWTIQLPLYRRVEDHVRLLEFKCVDLAEEYVYGGLVDPEGGGR